jgi:hypothetical protein
MCSFSEVDMPPYDFLRLPFFGALLMGRFVVPFFALPGPLPWRPAPLSAVRRFRPSLPPFIAVSTASSIATPALGVSWRSGSVASVRLNMGQASTGRDSAGPSPTPPAYSQVLMQQTGERAIHGGGDERVPNVVLLPSPFMATYRNYEWLIGPGKALDTTRLFLVATELFGNGRSSSPSNTPEPFHGPRFPVTARRRRGTSRSGTRATRPH